jgi:uncharacterized damage-inducible protein DinB
MVWYSDNTSRPKEAMMIPLATMRELFAYNYWARDRQLEACATLTEEQFQRPLGSSFSSLRDTLVHLVGAEWVWLERWNGRSPQSLPAVVELPTLAAITTLWIAVEQAMRDYLASLNEETLARPLTYTNFTGQTWTYPRWRSLLHLVNHQTYHRGQVTTLLRELGKRPAPVDLLVADDAGLFDTAVVR